MFMSEKLRACKVLVEACEYVKIIGIYSRELRLIARIVEQNEELILREWNDYFGL